MGVKKVALVCPLDWGIGHATRCVPVIAKLEELGYEVIVAAGGRPLDFIRKEYPGVQTVEFRGVNITYPENNRFGLKIFTLLPGILAGIWREHREIKKIAAETGANLIISDNRYGCWHRNIRSVFITHQLNIPVPGKLRVFRRLINRMNYWFISRYDACWVPDFEPHRGLAGDLSHPRRLPANARYIGILSRFSRKTDPLSDSVKLSFDLLIMLSGPEPQRSILEEKILRQLSGVNMQVAMVCGMPESDNAYVIDDRIHVFAHLPTERMRELILRSAIVVCRSGYSSIMDVVSMGKSAIFIPTPGQTEQEYLARYLLDKKIFFSMAQDNFDLLYALEMSTNFPGMVIRNDYRLLEEQLRNPGI